MPSLSKWRALLVPRSANNSSMLRVSSASISSPFRSSAASSEVTGSSIHRIAPAAPDTSITPAVDANYCIITHCNCSPQLDNILDVFLQMPLLDDRKVRTRTLDTLFTVCSGTPAAVDRCVAVGGVQIILNTLNSTAQPRQQPFPSPIVEESEKALLLLNLITASSNAGCVAALQQSSCIIATLSKKLLRMSEACTASAIAILCTLCHHSDAGLFRKELSETATPSKLVVVLQVASKDSTKQKAGRLLRLLKGEQY